LKEGFAAHITLGVANGIEPKEARSDAIQSHFCELQAAPLKDGPVHYYPDEELAIINLDKPTAFQCIFAAAYR